MELLDITEARRMSMHLIDDCHSSKAVRELDTIEAIACANTRLHLTEQLLDDKPELLTELDWFYRRTLADVEAVKEWTASYCDCFTDEEVA